MKRTWLMVLTAILLFKCGSEEVTSSKLSVYPNPCEEITIVYARNDESVAYVLRVYGAKGELILNEIVAPGANGNYQVDLQNQPNGKFQAILETPAGIIRKEFLKL
jgi:hypothetical protein